MSKQQEFRTYWRGFGYIDVLGYSVILPFKMKAFVFFSDDKLREANNNYAVEEDGWLVCDLRTGGSILSRGEDHYLSIKMADAIKATKAKVKKVGKLKYKEAVERALATINNDLSKIKESPEVKK